LGPSSQTIFSALRPWIAAHVLRPMHRDAAERIELRRPGVGSMRTTRSTPGTLSAAESSTLTTVPPHTCGRATTA
jgi:hypothetical protein